MPNRLNPPDQLGKKNGTQWYTLPVDSEEVRALHHDTVDLQPSQKWPRIANLHGISSQEP